MMQRLSIPRWPWAVLLISLLFTGLAPAAEAPTPTWPAATYNPRPQPDDVILPLPCGGAMAFRVVVTPNQDAGYPVTGPFTRTDGTPYLLLGKYEVSQLQAQALTAGAAGGACPRPQTARQTPQTGDWWAALELADRYSLWLNAAADNLPDCDGSPRPCLPRVDGIPAYLRLPTEAEWEYATRGGLSVPAASFAAPRYPMPDGLAAHAWFAANARGTLQPIGGRTASPLGLHDLYGNAAEWVLGPGRPAALVVGGHAASPATDLGAAWRWTLPPFTSDPGARTGLRLLASVPLFTSSDKVREAEQRRLAHAGATADVQAPPPPVQFLGNLRVTTNIAADVLVDGQVIGKTRPDALFEREIAVGEREVAVRAAGYTAQAQRLRLRTRQWTDAAFRLTPIEPPASVATAAPAPAPVPASAPVPAVTAEATPSTAAPPLQIEMIALRAGTFWMGSPENEPERFADEGPRHQVRVRAFSIGKYAVTFAQFDAFCAATGRQPPGDHGWGRGERPVINVSWEEAVAYAAWLSKETGEHYRLPTEAEWEYAARAGTTTPFWTGHCIKTDQANYNGNYDYAVCRAKTGVYRNRTLRVGSLPANPWGLHEVHGNVWEWVQDQYHDSYQGAPSDGSAWEAGDRSARVLRGGSWFYSPRFLRSASRDRGDAGYRHYDLGFRLASDTPETPDSRVGPRDATVRAGGDSVKSPDQSSKGWPDRSPGVSAADITEPTLLMPRFDFEPPMIALPGGQFQMGSPEDEPERSSDESPRHPVRLAPFAIGQTEVTFAQYDAFCTATGRQPPDDRGWGRGQRPVINVSWEDAVAYAVWLSNETGATYRLPTEAEWEYAARAGTTTPFWTGHCIKTEQASYDGNYDYAGCGAKTGVYRKQTVPVGSLPANPWGLHEVHGNVWEWVQDPYHDSYQSAPSDGRAWEAGGSGRRVLRGGSWGNYPWVLRSAYRLWFDAGDRYFILGFRVARTLSP